MKLISVLALGLSIGFFGCISKTTRKMASVQTKTIGEFADYTMANTVSVNRMPAGVGAVELSGPNDDVLITLDLRHSYGENSQNADFVISVRSQPAIAGRISGSSKGSLHSRWFTAIMADVRQNGWRPTAFQVVRTMQLRMGSLLSLPADQHDSQTRTILLEGRDSLYSVYSDLRPAQ